MWILLSTSNMFIVTLLRIIDNHPTWPVLDMNSSVLVRVIYIVLCFKNCQNGREKDHYHAHGINGLGGDNGMNRNSSNEKEIENNTDWLARVKDILIGCTFGHSALLL